MVSKKDRLEYFKKILNKGLCDSMVQERKKDYDELMELFENHPEYPKKLLNVCDMKIVRNKRNSKYYEINLIRNDGSIEDISYRCCIYPRKDNHNLNQAMRNCIDDQIRNFRKQCKNQCEFCGNVDDIHIDHIYKFEHLVSDFMSLVNTIQVPTIFQDSKDNTAIFREEDSVFSKEWYIYHQNNARLRPLCSKCNLGRIYTKDT